VAAEHAEALEELFCEALEEAADPGEALRGFRFRRALEAVLGLATAGNVFMQRCEPWKTFKQDPALAGSQLSMLCTWLGLLARWLAPFAPHKAQALWEQLGCSGAVEAAGWPSIPSRGAWSTASLAGQRLGELEGLFPRLEAEQAEA
jgi:methionyl-tRNA synthetase